MRLPASWLEAAAHRRRGSSRLPGLAFVARWAAGPPERAATLASRFGTAPATPPRARRQLAQLTFAAGIVDVTRAILPLLADDTSPGLDVARAAIALEAGRYREALERAVRAADAAVPGACASAERIRGQLAILEPGWLPDAGPAAARLSELRGRGVPGRVLHVVSVALPHRQAGYTVRTQEVARCQAAVDLDPHVLVRSGFPRGNGPRLDIVGGIPYHGITPDVASARADRLLDAVAQSAAAVLEEVRPAVIQPASNHVQAQLGLALGRAMGVPVVYEVRGFWEDSWAADRSHDEAAAVATDRYRMTRAVETGAMLAADAVVTLSETMRQEIVARGCRPENVVVVPNAVDVERFRPGPRDARLAASVGIEPRDPTVGYVTTFWPFEGIPLLLEAAARLRTDHPRLHVVLVGDGPDRPAIELAARKLGIDGGTLVMPGRVPHEEIMAWYSLIDVFVVPRTPHRVSRLVTPLKPFEAMALERAVVVSDLPALREIVQPGETGMIFRPDDAADLAGAIGELLDDPDLRTRLGRQAREWVAAERTWAGNGRRYRTLFEKLGVA